MPLVGKPFQKGVSGNPGGRPKLSKDLLNTKEFTDYELRRVISKYFRMKKEACKEAGQSETLPMIEVAIARAVQKAAHLGDITRIIPLIERVCGKMKDKVEHTDGTELEREKIRAMSDSELKKLVKNNDLEEVQ